MESRAHRLRCNLAQHRRSSALTGTLTVALLVMMWFPGGNEPADHSEDVLPRSTQPR